LEPNTHTLLTIQNPGEDSVVINPFGALTPEQAAEQYGGQIKHGAFVTLVDRDVRSGNTVGGVILIADREADGRLYLQNNEYMTEDNPHKADVDDIGAVVASCDVPEDVPEPELETFTVFGNNDDSEDFVAVVAATDDTVYDVGVKAGLVDEGYESDVEIRLILKGDWSHLEPIAV
jgi:hypothetical protein